MGILNLTDPTTRLLVMLVIGTPLMLSIDLTSASVALVLELLVLAPLCGFRYRQHWRRMLPVLVIAPFAGLSMLLYARPGGETYFSFGPVIVTENSVGLAIALTVRVLAIALPAVMLTKDLDPSRLGDGLVQLWKLPERFVVGAVAGVRLVTLFRRDWVALERARRARGLERQWANAPRQAFALLVLALRRAGRLATTMEGRGFRSGDRTRLRTAAFTRWDVLLLTVGVALPAVALLTAFATGDFALLGVH
ncbi:MAG TPA: energy-coupling factor transporter transmembrane protein EcfT [Candidatus Corynebacterium avicola]|uniref:Energy-coupling factor transporter transmembrane protein EcfT n=1 Tax=Candidatus Corynebacterium avicola TaxID=2838527 RepID=A0A9D1RMZ6_9CORY|nr:energy-coupling factor transporter transmembrane protein EcfT [Candidatus Corynebacterium avicola]